MSKDKKKSVAEKLSDSAAQVNREAGGDNFEKLSQELQRDIPKVAVNFNEKLVELETVNAHKENSKVRYQRELDAGNEESMSSCLKQVRERNEQAGKLRSELARFPEEVQKLYARKERISGLARDGQEEAASKVREAEKLLKKAAEKVGRVYALMGQINDLNVSVQGIIRVQKKEKAASEAEIKTPRDNSRGFWLELDDPFAAGTLRTYFNLKTPIDEAKLRTAFVGSEELKTRFSDLKSYMDSERKIILKSKDLDDMNLPCVLSYEDKETKLALENYILRAAGSGDRRREFAAKMALSKCR